MATSCIHWAISLKFVCSAFRFKSTRCSALRGQQDCLLQFAAFFLSSCFLSRVNAFPLSFPLQSRCFIKFCNGNSKSIAKCAALNFNCANFAARPKNEKRKQTARRGDSGHNYACFSCLYYYIHKHFYFFCCCLFLLVVISFALAWYWVWACACAWACNAPSGIIEIVCAILHSKG